MKLPHPLPPQTEMSGCNTECSGPCWHRSRYNVRTYIYPQSPITQSVTLPTEGELDSDPAKHSIWDPLRAKGRGLTTAVEFKSLMLLLLAPIMSAVMSSNLNSLQLYGVSGMGTRWFMVSSHTGGESMRVILHLVFSPGTLSWLHVSLVSPHDVRTPSIAGVVLNESQHKNTFEYLDWAITKNRDS